jgi:hypothetical protein
MQKVQHFGGFIHQIQVRQPIGKKDFYTNRVPKKKEDGGFFVFGGSELWTLLKYSRSKLKNKKPLAVDVLFKACPMIPLSGWSNRPDGTFKRR